MKKFWKKFKYFFLFLWYYKKLWKCNLTWDNLELGTILNSNGFEIKIYWVASKQQTTYRTYYVKSI